MHNGFVAAIPGRRKFSLRARSTPGRSPATAGFFGHFGCKGNCEIHLAFESVNTDNKDRKFIAHLKPFTRPSPDKLPSSRLKHIKVVHQ
jgi:hypothetical protein